MRFVRFNGSKLGLLTDDGEGIVDLSEELGLSSEDPLKEYVRGEYDAAPYADAGVDRDRADVRLEAPIRRPGKVVAAAGNYADHVGELDEKYVHPDQRAQVDEMKYFLKAPSSVIGPDDGVELPFADRRCDHEVELAFVVGEDMKDVSPETAIEHVFGYTLLLDISIRGTEDRSYRKSFDTFTPIGPCVTTADEVGDPQDLDLSLSVNGETRQSTNTELMINTCAEIASYASIANTLEAGDVVATGTPSGVHPLQGGDEIYATAESIGEMRLDVTRRDVVFEELDLRSGTFLRE